MKRYDIFILPGVSHEAADLEACPLAEISRYPWKEGIDAYTPEAGARLAALDEGICAELFAMEKKLRSEVAEQNGPVCHDSCLEFFFNADPQRSDRYFNFEINPSGTLYLAIGRERKDRVKLFPEDYKKLFKINTQINAGESWKVSFVIPYAYIREYYPQFSMQAGRHMAGNFYKCGDKTERPHYGCWNDIDWPHPDFHRPEFFAQLSFVKLR